MTAGLLAHGSLPSVAFPAPCGASGFIDGKLSAYSCRGSHGIEPCSQLGPCGHRLAGKLHADAETVNSQNGCQTACKPGSVHPHQNCFWRKLDGHSSGTPIAGRLARPTRMTNRKRFCRFASAAIPIWSCSRWGLPCRRRCRKRGALLPHPFTLAMTGHGGLLSVALSLGSPPPGVTRHRVSVEPGLSSMISHRGRPAVWHRRTGRPCTARRQAERLSRPSRC